MRKFFSFFLILWKESRKPKQFFNEDDVMADHYNDELFADRLLCLGFIDGKAVLFHFETYEVWHTEDNYEINPDAIKRLKERLEKMGKKVKKKVVENEETPMFV